MKKRIQKKLAFNRLTLADLNPERMDRLIAGRELDTNFDCNSENCFTEGCPSQFCPPETEQCGGLTRCSVHSGCAM